MSKIYEVTFEEFPGSTKIVLADNFDEAVSKARKWLRVGELTESERQSDIESIHMYGEIDFA